MYLDDIEQSIISRFLQREIKITLNNKIIKQGRLILFCIKDFYLVFMILSGRSKKLIELPIPFNVSFEKESASLDYTLQSFTEDNYDTLLKVKLLHFEKPVKYYNNKLNITLL